MCQELTPDPGLFNKSLSYKADIVMGLPFTLISFKGEHCSLAKKWFFQALHLQLRLWGLTEHCRAAAALPGLCHHRAVWSQASRPVQPSQTRPYLCNPTALKPRYHADFSLTHVILVWKGSTVLNVVITIWSFWGEMNHIIRIYF